MVEGWRGGSEEVGATERHARVHTLSMVHRIPLRSLYCPPPSIIGLLVPGS
jgi:hypothetical protein